MLVLIATFLPPAPPPQPGLNAQPPSTAAAPSSGIEPGIGRELARTRAALLAGVEYDLTFDLRDTGDSVSGEVVIRFRLPEGGPPAEGIVLDFGGAELTETRINGKDTAPLERVHDHVVLPASALSYADNEFQARFRSAVAETGTPLTRYRDRATGQRFLYTLLVPADAHLLFPCFDQPDLKARFRLRVLAPAADEVVANGVPEAVAGEGGARVWDFAPTRPLSTYLLAFAAGPFQIVHSPLPPLQTVGGPAPPMRIYHRGDAALELDSVAVFDLHRRAADRLADLYRHPFPFAKLDIVLVPGFPYNGMEHAGCIFYRETSLAFDHQPTPGELLRRSTLIFHEVTHQWFGNLVSFVWFDDLWLKEGFANLMGYRLVEELQPEHKAWLRFLQRIKPAAYRVDGSPGTTAVHQPLGNLADAKSNYGPIVYNKAPAVLHELAERLGTARFDLGVSRFLTRHAYGNATWHDLLTALQEAAGGELERWSERFILEPGVPTVVATWSVGVDGRLTRFAVRQRPTADDAGGLWPMRVQVLVSADGKRHAFAVDLDEAEAEVGQLVGSPVPEWVLLNPRDVAYGVFLLDDVSQAALLGVAPGESDPLLRAVMLTALRENVRAGRLDPAHFADCLLRRTEVEQDPDDLSWLLETLHEPLWRWLPDNRALPLRREAERQLCERARGDEPALALIAFRHLARSGRSDAVLELLRAAVEHRRLPGGAELGPQDVYLGWAALVAAGRGDPALRRRLPETGDVGRLRYLAGAASPDADDKQTYFESYFQDAEPPEQWVSASLSFFHWPGQEDLTLPYLSRALERVLWVKEKRKIFFMPAWIDGFVNAHSSERALAVVEAFAAERSDLPIDVRRKLEQSLDELRRAVRLRQRWAR